jgi:hypothetical protein
LRKHEAAWAAFSVARFEGYGIDYRRTSRTGSKRRDPFEPGIQVTIVLLKGVDPCCRVCAAKRAATNPRACCCWIVAMIVHMARALP